MQKEVVMAYFKVPSQYLPAGTEENNGTLNSDSQPLVWELYAWYSEYKAGFLTTILEHLVRDVQDLQNT
jgi:hypothetical protein